MIAIPRKPTSIGGIKKLARELKKGSGNAHFQTLNLAAQIAGFHSFNHARNSLASSASPETNSHRYQVTISARWRDWQGGKGSVSATVSLPKPLHQLVDPQSFLGLLSGFVVSGPEDLSFVSILPGEGHTEMRVFTAARAIRFISATGLVPSSTPRNALPFFKDSFSSQGEIPGGDHTRFWKDPVSGHHVVTDEPYFGNDTPPWARAQRVAWANEHQLSVEFPKWPGMHNPGYGTRMTLFSLSLDLKSYVRSLENLPAPGEGYDADLLEPDFRKRV